LARRSPSIACFFVGVGLPASADEPPRRLVGFDKVWLDPGQQRRIRVVIDQKRAANHSLGIWDAALQAWVVPNDAYQASRRTLGERHGPNRHHDRAGPRE
jgi:hypothetical protein